MGKKQRHNKVAVIFEQVGVLQLLDEQKVTVKLRPILANVAVELWVILAKLR